jgi:hypothetical protein
MGHMFGILAVIPFTMLLTVSFFVLFARQKAEDSNLKMFGLIVAVLLWVGAAIVLVAGVTSMVCGGNGWCGKMAMHKMEMMHPGGPMGMHGQGMMGKCCPPDMSPEGKSDKPEGKPEPKQK